jgi:hypothetical protein
VIGAARRGAAALLTLLLAAPWVRAAPTPTPSWRADQPGAELDIALITVGPGEVYWQRFGHNAILVHDRASGEAVLYNYGIFDFDEADFFLNFVRGHMRYSMVGGPPGPELAMYAAEGRWVDMQPLNLSPAQRVRLREMLRTNALPENARYRYDYFLSNCSTKVRDAIDQATGGAVARALQPRSSGFSLRDHALRLTAPDLPVFLGIDMGLGPFTDRATSLWEEMFVPMVVADRLPEVRVVDDAGQDVPLAGPRQRLVAGVLSDPAEVPPSWWWRYALVGLGLASALTALQRARRAAWARGLFAGLVLLLSVSATAGGLFLIGVWGFTEHRAAWANHNLLLFNPLFVLLIPSAFAALRRDWQPTRLNLAVTRVAVLCALLALALKVVPGWAQQNLGWLLFWLPVHIALARAYTRSRHGR